MLVDGLCKKCNKWFDAHWHTFPDHTYKCPHCKNKNQSTITIHTDEDGDYNIKRENYEYED